MYFNLSAVEQWVVWYVHCLFLWLRTSWMRFVAESIENSSQLSLQECKISFPGHVVAWRGWEPQSIGGILLKWLVMLPLLTLAVLFGLLMGIFKICLWFTILPFFVLGTVLFAGMKVHARHPPKFGNA